MQRTEELVARILHCREVYEEQELNKIAIMRLEKSITKIMREKLVYGKKTSFYGLAIHTISLLKLQEIHEKFFL